MQNQFNENDRVQWDQIFKTPNPVWRQAPEQAFMKDALEFFRSIEAYSILDIGCGMGIWSIYLARNGYQVSGTDFSENAIQICRDWAKDEKLDAKFEVATITVDPYPKQIFDAVVASMIFENVSRNEMDQAISVLREKVNPGGGLFALFNPFLTDKHKDEILKNSNNPTKNVTSMTYTDDEIQNAFPGFKTVIFKKYSLQGLDFRGIALRKL